MENRLNEAIRKVREDRHKARRYTALLLVLAMMTSMFVSWDLRQVGVALTDSVYSCGLVEHIHNESCYTRELICGYTEGEIIGTDTTADSTASKTEPASSETVASKSEETKPASSETAASKSEETKPASSETAASKSEETTPASSETVASKSEETTPASSETVASESTGTDSVESESTASDSVASESAASETTGTESSSTELETTETESAASSEAQADHSYDSYDDYYNNAASEELTYAPLTMVGENSIDELDSSEMQVHHHTDACYKKVLTCGMVEHTHTAACLADTTADLESEADWEQYKQDSESVWTEALVKVAQAQLDYTESEKNFVVDEALGETLEDAHHYTRYGAWYGNEYGKWDFMFVAFCQHYAGIPEDSIPGRAALDALLADMKNSKYLEDNGADALYGDIVTYYNSDNEETIGIVVDDTDEDTIKVISGDVDGKVAEVTVNLTDVTHTILVDYAYAEYKGIAGDYAIMTTEETGSIALNKEWITDVTIERDGQTVSGDLTLDDGDEIILGYKYEIPKGQLPSNYTVTYKLPEGIKLKDEVVNQNITRSSTDDTVIGTYSISKDGLVKLVFYKDKVSQNTVLPGDFSLRAKVDASGADEEGKFEIEIPGHKITVKKNFDLSISKTGAEPVVENKKTYIQYTVTVSSQNGYNQNITITDILNDNWDNNAHPGTYDKNSFELKKNGTTVGISDKLTFNDNTTGSNNPNKTCKSFEIKNLEKLNAGESYVLTYRVEVGSLEGNANVASTLTNRAEANGHTATVNKTFSKKIEKEGKYNSNTGYIDWTIKVNNPYGTDLNGTKIEDEVQTSGATIVDGVKIYQNYYPEYTGGTLDIKTDKSGFTYTFGEGCTANLYVIKYSTTVPENAKAVENKVTETTPDGGKYEETSSGTVSEGGGTEDTWKLTKSTAADQITTEDGKAGTASWKLELDFPETWTSYEIKDNIFDISPSDGSGDYSDSHYAIASELQKAIEDNLKITDASGKVLTYSDLASKRIKLEIRYGDALWWGNEVQKDNTTTHVRNFQIKLTNNGYNGEKLTKLTLDSYTTHVDLSKIPDSVNKVTIKNNAGNDATYTYKKSDASLVKKVYKDSNYSNEVSDGEVDWNSNPNANTNLYYELLLKMDEFTDETIVIKDTLPEGLVFDKASADWCHNQYYIGPDGPGGNINTNKRFTAELDNDGRTITFTFNLKDILEQIEKENIQGVRIRYQVHVDDSDWKDSSLNILSKVYKNSAEWKGQKVETPVTVKRDDKEIIQKTGEQINGTTNAKYSIVVNPSGFDLLEGHDGNITLTDVMEVDTQGYTATLDESSLKVYLYPKEQNPTPLSTSEYEYTIEKDTSNTGRDKTILKLTLQNKTGYVVEYTYHTDAGMNAVTLKNEATLTGGWSSKKNNQLTELSSEAHAGNSMLTVYKVDAQNNAVHLAGAKFKLYTFENGAWNEGVEATTGEDGTLKYSLTETLSGKVKLEYDTLYKLIETDAPEGYTKSDQVHYFLWVMGSESKDAAYNKAVSSGAPDGISKEDITFYKDKSDYTIYVQNERTGLLIEKQWRKTDGAEMTNPPVNKIGVTLYKFPKGGTKADAQTDRVITLTAGDNWKVVLNDLDANYLYYVEEIDCPADYTVSYGVTNDGKLTGKILIVNTGDEKDSYELPSTGSTGTTPYTACGALMMGAAVMYGYHSKRKRGRRAE